MSKTHFQTLLTFCVWLLAPILLLALTGCAKNYVVLLPDDNGTLGRVVVTAPKGTVELSQKNQGTVIGGAQGDTFIVTDEELKKDFGSAMAASPKKPSSYLLYFEAGQANLTSASQAEIPKIKEDVAQRPGADLTIVGHTDTLGDGQANYQLGLTRAQQIAEMIGTTARMAVTSHGEKNLLVKTPDNVDEPQNRRVEVIVR